MARIGIQHLRRREFHRLTEIEYEHPLAQLAHDREVVTDEQNAHPEIALEILQQVDDLRLNRDV